jgi:hypothetical protein
MNLWTGTTTSPSAARFATAQLVDLTDPLPRSADRPHAGLSPGAAGSQLADGSWPSAISHRPRA